MGQNYTMIPGLLAGSDSNMNLMANRPIDSAFVFDGMLVNPTYDQAAEAARYVRAAPMKSGDDSAQDFAGMDNNYMANSYSAAANADDTTIFDTVNFDTCECQAPICGD